MRLSILLVAAALSACVTLGRPFDAGRIKTIQAGKTTQAQIHDAFGEPFRTGVDTGDVAWTYVNYHFGLLGPQKATDLVVKFNADGTVRSYTYNTTEPEPAPAR